MEKVPSVTLGAIIAVPFSVLRLVRGFLERKLVLNRECSKHVRLQFLMDFSLTLVAGCSVILFNRFVYGFPHLSGIIFLFGVLVFGFFIGLDMALHRERVLISENIYTGSHPLVPHRLPTPMARKFSIVALITTFFVVMIVGLAIARDFAWLSTTGKMEIDLSFAQRSVMIDVIFVISGLFSLSANLIFSYSKNLGMLFNNETKVLEKVSRGDLSEMVPVVTNDEFGYIANLTNTMIRGLRHRMKLINSLKLAEDVQKSLLPKAPLEFYGIDSSGTSIYCEQTGGDYYDFFDLGDDRLGIIVADSADHGIGAALHMTTTRAFLKYGIGYYKGPVPLMEKVNQHLFYDSREQGRFVTAFFLEINRSLKQIQWIRAGHEPALIYYPSEDIFDELMGKGIALGVDRDAVFTATLSDRWEKGMIVFIGTDGIREMRNGKGEPFGNERLKKVIRECSGRSALEIQRKVIESLAFFQKDGPQEDDVTLVIAKIVK